MTLLKDILAIDNGARFFNVDLHIHSYGASADVKDPKMTPQSIVDSAMAQGLSVIAITDHNCDTNVQAALTHAQQFAGQLLVLPGAEITTANGHLLVYFAPERAADLSRLLAKLDLIGSPGADNTHTAKSMADTIAETERLGGLCIAAHIDRQKTGFEMLAAGYPNWKRDILSSVGLYGFEYDDPSHLNWYSDSDDHGSAGAERENLLRSRAAIPALKGRHRLAHVQNSDAHSMSAFQSAAADKSWTRVKLTELSFAALRTALIDPTARVRATAAVPRSFPRIHGIIITGGFLNGEAIHFSDNLNCFIGGRGTGKSTAIRSLAYCFGLHDAFGEYGNCPESVVVYCEDADGVVYRYQRSKGGSIAVRAKDDNTIADVPADVFRIEYFGQGELAEVAKDPLNSPQLFQTFLDRHIILADVLNSEASLVGRLHENAARLGPLENSFAQLPEKKKNLASVETKLKIAEEGKLRDIVGVQTRIASEQVLRASIEEVAQAYASGLSLSVLERNFDNLSTTAGQVTGDPTSAASLQAIKQTMVETNALLKGKAAEINNALATKAAQLRQHCGVLKANHARLEAEVAGKIAELKSRGLAGNIAELQQLLKTKTSVSREITVIEQQWSDLEACRTQRAGLLSDLRVARETMSARRKAQLANINKNLSVTITDYVVFVKYDAVGIIDEFLSFIQKHMTGSWLPEQVARQLCQRVTPSDLADWVSARDVASIAKTASIDEKWAKEIQQKLCYWHLLFELQVIAKSPRPTITVRTKATPPREVPVVQLSDGQRHTILLTIAMLADSNVPLVIDQPEDDLDNAFIFSSIVATLRAIKERRQVILVTHNANIAVLGDSELLIPLRRDGDCGKAFDRGSIDSAATKVCVQNILEGGAEAFQRRRHIYGH